MPPQAKTIQIFLPGGQPRGIRIAEITTRIVQAVSVPRTQLAAVFQRAEIEHVAAYLLFGETDESAKPIVYIGQTEDLKGRLKSHDATKDFWQTAVFLISRTHSFTQAHIRYLEWLFIKHAREAKRYDLDNGNEGSKPFVTEPMEADLMEVFETAGVLLGVLGFPVFEPVAATQRGPKREIYYCTGLGGADARGELVEEGFVLLAGSKCRKALVPSVRGKSLDNKRRALLHHKILEDRGDHLLLTEDYLMKSASGTAGLVLGRSANGWVEWKDKQGTTLNDLKRQQEMEK